jgi:hypothetical protein
MVVVFASPSFDHTMTAPQHFETFSVGVLIGFLGGLFGKGGSAEQVIELADKEIEACCPDGKHLLDALVKCRRIAADYGSEQEKNSHLLEAERRSEWIRAEAELFHGGANSRSEAHRSSLSQLCEELRQEFEEVSGRPQSWLRRLDPDGRIREECKNNSLLRLLAGEIEQLREKMQLGKSIEDLKAEGQRLAGSGEEYESLYEQKKQKLIAGGGAWAQLIIDLSSGMSNAKARLKAIKEAYKACETAISYLNSSKKELEKAKTWGTIDMMGGKFISSAIKHSHIKSAISDAGSANTIIRDMSSVSANVDITEIDIKSAGAGRTSDIFMDNIVIDMFVQNRIEDSLGNVSTVKSNLQSRLCKLMVMEHQVASTCRRSCTSARRR